jgi:hypothetical protein
MDFLHYAIPATYSSQSVLVDVHDIDIVIEVHHTWRNRYGVKDSALDFQGAVAPV